MEKNKEDKILKETKGICDHCAKIVSAEVIDKNGVVFIRKKCPEHGISEHQHVWDDVETYLAFSKMNIVSGAASDKVVINLTNRCNMNCPICFANSNELSHPDFPKEKLKDLNNFKYVYLTGGEPTVKDDLFDYIRSLKKQGHKVVVFSNGLKLADKKYVLEIKKSGVDLIILQYDSPDEKDNLLIRGRNVLDFKKKALDNLEEFQIPVFLNAVVIKNNISKSKELIDLSRKYKNIKVMALSPVWEIGRFDHSYFIPTSGVLDQIETSTSIKKKDFLLSYAFLLNLEYLFSKIKKNKRFFSKCVISCPVLVDEKEYIPLNRIFNLEKLNQKIEKINKLFFLNFISLFLYFLLVELFFNFFRNKNFRKMIFLMLKNIKFIFKGKLFMFNPFLLLTVITFPDKKNLDMDFISTCNFYSMSAESGKTMPACLFRVDLNQEK